MCRFLSICISFVIAFASPAFASEDFTKKELISARIDILKTKEALEKELEFINTQLEPDGKCSNAKTYVQAGTIILGLSYFWIGARRSYRKYQNAKMTRAEFYKYYKTRPNLKQHSWLFRNLTEEVKVFKKAANFKMYTGLSLQLAWAASLLVPDQTFKLSCNAVSDLIIGTENVVAGFEEVEQSIKLRIQTADEN